MAQTGAAPGETDLYEAEWEDEDIGEASMSSFHSIYLQCGDGSILCVYPVRGDSNRSIVRSQDFSKRLKEELAKHGGKK